MDTDTTAEKTAANDKAAELVANSPDDAWFWVEDKDTRHRYAIGKSAFLPKSHVLILDEEGTPLSGRQTDGTVRPSVHRNEIDLKSLPSNTDTAQTAEPVPTDPAEVPAVPSGRPADSDKENKR